MKKTIGQKIRELRQAKGISLDALGKLCGLTGAYLGRLERHEEGFNNPTVETLDGIAKALGLPSYNLLLGPETYKKNDHENNSTPLNDQIPVIGLTNAGKSNIAWDDQGYPVGHGFEYIDRPSFLKNEKYAFGAKISGDSMTPRVRPGDKIIVAPNKQIVSGDDILVRLKNDEVYIKEVKFQGSMVILMSVNPAYEPMFIKKSEIRFMYKVALILPK